MTLEDVVKLRKKWTGDIGAAAKDVLVLCDEVERLLKEKRRDEEEGCGDDAKE